ncbi:YslB family protein [Lactobacillus kefiranofaciens subsp. kefirgranum]|uniref:YslB family protein n=1 Tax=Lactobacillus kefiranofaciens TaxID=267818 RepID=UPI0006F06BF9|nr:YslB family protein [Lactobacillus kefiranofaciens]KRL30236.1 YslB like protein [Lactobacillus kefiranofaciens subsp. kefirgranum DSM 10550 = JCM 8572]
MNKFMTENTEHSNEHVYFINQLYRDFLLPTILGDDNATILYWAGKRIARHYDLADLDDLVEFFNMAQFSQLEKVKERRSSTTFEISGQNVEDRLNSDSKEFSLESGMIAEAVQKSTGRTTESEIHILDKAKKVQIIARFG